MKEPKKDEVDEVDEDIGHYAYSLNKDGPEPQVKDDLRDAESPPCRPLCFSFFAALGSSNKSVLEIYIYI